MTADREATGHSIPAPPAFGVFPTVAETPQRASLPPCLVHGFRVVWGLRDADRRGYPMDGEETASGPSRGETQAERDARVKAAFKAYLYGRTVPGEAGKPERSKPLADITPLWEAMWAAADFSWDGLADAGWERGRRANPAQILKRWRASADFPGVGTVVGAGERAYKEATLQDYWRFVFWSAEAGEAFGPWDPAAIDDAMAVNGLLQALPDGRVFHALHCQDAQLSVALDTEGAGADLHRAAASVAVEGTSGAASALAHLLQFALKGASAFAGDKAPDSRVQLSGARVVGLDAAWRAFAEGGHDRSLHIEAQLSDHSGLNASGLTFGDGAGFSGAMLGEGATFTEATLGDRADFSGATLGEGAMFVLATLGDGADFFAATLGDRATFTGATLKGRASWVRAVFRGVSDFSEITWSDDTHYGGAFDSARFEDFANFKTTNFSAFAALHDATFKQRLLLQPPSEGQRPDDMFRAARAAAEQRIEDEIAGIADWEKRGDESDARFAARKKAAPDEIRDRVWSELSGGYRTAKKAMEDAGDFDREQTFYRFEVQARMERPRINPGERLAAWFYRVFSDYGASVGRPFVWLFGLMFGFAGVYLLMAALVTERAIDPPYRTEAPYHRLGEPAAPTWEAMELSINNAFRPLSALSTDVPREDRPNAACADCSVSDALLFHKDGWVRFTVKALAIIQSLLSFVLAFLFALAVRRKFQIS